MFCYWLVSLFLFSCLFVSACCPPVPFPFFRARVFIFYRAQRYRFLMKKHSQIVQIYSQIVQFDFQVVQIFLFSLQTAIFRYIKKSLPRG